MRTAIAAPPDDSRQPVLVQIADCFGQLIDRPIEHRVLRRAAKLLRERGWTQKLSVDQTGALCIYAAIVRAADWETRLIASSASLLAIRLGTREIQAWNDRPKRTLEEVLTQLF